ncbi:MAG: dihydrofolate reductase [Erythrobacter sp.]
MVAMSGKNTLRQLTSIVAIDLRGAIGCDNTLPWRLKSDMAFFREKTIGNSVIMGRKTYESLGSKPLPKRNNIVLSHNTVLFAGIPSCQLSRSIDEALFLAEKNDDEETFVIGGAQTYEQFNSLVDRYLVTIVDHEVPNADAFLSNKVLKTLRNWGGTEVASFKATEQDEFSFSIFEAIAPDVDARRASRMRLIEDFATKASPKKASLNSRRITKPHTQNAFAF